MFNVFLPLLFIIISYLRSAGFKKQPAKPSRYNLCPPLILRTNLNCFRLIVSNFYHRRYTLKAPNSKAHPHTSVVTGRHKRDNGAGFLINSVSPVHRTTGHATPQQSPNKQRNHPFSAILPFDCLEL